MIEREYLGVRTVARMLGCHVNTVTRIAPEQLPYWRLNERGDRRYDRLDVLLFIERRKVPK